MAWPLLKVREATLEHYFGVVIVPPLNIILIILLIALCKYLLLASFFSNDNRSFVRKDHL